MKTLLLPKYYTADSNSLYSAAMSENLNVQRVDLHADINTRNKYIIYLDTFTKTELSLYCYSPPLDWCLTLPVKYLKRNIYKLTAADLKQINEKAFYKPADDKWFKAGIYTSINDITTLMDVQDYFIVLKSDVVDFEYEYRFFISNNRIDAASIYAINGVLAKTSNGYPVYDDLETEARSFVWELLNDSKIEIPKSFVLDVGRLRNSSDWAVVEINPAWASGLYGCDPVGVLQCLKVCSE